MWARDLKKKKKKKKTPRGVGGGPKGGGGGGGAQKKKKKKKKKISRRVWRGLKWATMSLRISLIWARLGSGGGGRRLWTKGSEERTTVFHSPVEIPDDWRIQNFHGVGRWKDEFWGRRCHVDALAWWFLRWLVFGIGWRSCLDGFDFGIDVGKPRGDRVEVAWRSRGWGRWGGFTVWWLVWFISINSVLGWIVSSCSGWEGIRIPSRREGPYLE